MIRAIVLSASLSLASLTAGAATLVSYEPIPAAGAIGANATGVGVTAAPLARGPGVSQTTPVPGNNYNSSGFGTASEAAAIAAGDFLTWGFTSLAPFDLDTLSLAYGRGSNGPTAISVDLSINGGGFVNVFDDAAIQVGVEQNAGIDLSAFDAVTSAQFRLSGWSAATLSGRFSLADTDIGDFDDLGSGVVVTGTLTPVPLPAGAPLMLLALASIGLLARRPS